MKTILIAVLTAGLAACGGDDPEAADAGLCEPAGNEMQVDASCFEEWPLNVDSGTLVCEDDAVVFDTGEALFAVNREAELIGVQPITPLTAEGVDDDLTTAADVEPLISEGLSLCEE